MDPVWQYIFAIRKLLFFLSGSNCCTMVRLRNSFRTLPFWLLLLGVAATIAALQIYGGAYQAEFDAHADEASHAVSSLLVRDYLAQWPWPSPLPWAMRYYVHYPKVAIGHWPPGYYAIQGVWWLFTPPGRVSAMVLNVVVGTASIGLFLLLARRIRDSWPALVATAALLFLPIVQESYTQVMLELPSLLFSLLLLWTLARFLERPGFRTLVYVTLALLGTIAIKGTGAVLVAGPLLAVALSGIWRRLPVRYWVVALLAALSLLAIFLIQYRGEWQSIRMMGGLGSSRIPWGVLLLPDIVGAGTVALAAAGAVTVMRWRDPVPVAALSLLLSMMAISYYVRAMREPRHWIAAAPLLILLALALYARLEQWSGGGLRRGVVALGVLAAAACLHPYRFYRQEPAGFNALAGQIRQPARMLVSSSLGWGEGPWIAVAALREPRPSSVIIRATKFLSSSDWNGLAYKSLVFTPADIERKLDESGVEIVILHDAVKHRVPGQPPMAHHLLLAETLQSHPSWRACAAAGELMAYCRIGPARVPRVPLRMDFRNRIGTYIEETP